MSKTDTTPSTITLYDWEASSLLFRKKGETDPKYTYLYGEGETSDVIGPVKIYGFAEANHGDKWFLFWVADCMSPPAYLVKADNESDAHEQFITDFEDMVSITDHFEDYTDDSRAKAMNESMRTRGHFSGLTEEDIAALGITDLSCTYNDNGTPCDTQHVQMAEVELIEARAYPFGANSHEQIVYLHDNLNRLYWAAKGLADKSPSLAGVGLHHDLERVKEELKNSKRTLDGKVPMNPALPVVNGLLAVIMEFRQHLEGVANPPINDDPRIVAALEYYHTATRQD